MQGLGPKLTGALRQLYSAPPARTELTPMAGDASTRRYYRLHVPEPGNGPRSLVVMELPQEGPSSGGVQAPSLAARERGSELPFLNVQRLLSARGVRVPRVHAVDMARGVLLLEDLGDETFESRVNRVSPAAWPTMYASAVELLADMHRRCAEPEPGCIAYSRSFDRALLRWELEHFREWGLEALVGALGAGDRAWLGHRFDDLTDKLLQVPTGFVHRDYQSRNLMWCHEDGGESLAVIDFQDALIGPRWYDLVALLCDSYVALPLALQKAMLERYAEAAGIGHAHRRRFELEFWLVAVQRKLKDAGRFVYIDRVRRNPTLLGGVPQSLVYVGCALAELDGLDGLAERLGRWLPGFPDRVPVPRSG